MAEPQLSVRSAKARDLAHRLARRENRSIADVVERALESYEIREAGREPAPTFYAHLAQAVAPTSIWRKSSEKAVRLIQDLKFDFRRTNDLAPPA